MTTKKLLGRKNQLTTLNALLNPHHPTNHSYKIYIFGLPATGKTFTIKHYLSNNPKIKHAYFDCNTYFSEKNMFHSIVNSLDHNFINIKYSCVNIYKFSQALNTIINTTLKNNLDRPICIVLDHIKSLTKHNPNLLQAFLRLEEIINTSINIVLIDSCYNYDIEEVSGGVSMFPLYFESYTKNMTIDILFHNFKNLESENKLKEICLNAYNYFSPITKNLNDLSKAISLLLSKPNEISPINKNLLSNSKLIYKEIGKNFYSFIHLSSFNSKIDKKFVKSKIEIELSFSTKYLLIAAYIASYSLIRRLPKRRRRNKKKVESILSKPKSFSLIRLMGIFRNIFQYENYKFSVPKWMIYVNLSTLVSLSLLYNIAGEDMLKRTKYVCNVNYEFVKKIAFNVEFPIDEWFDK